MKGAAAAKLIQDATSSPGVFVFGELFQLAGVQELEKNEQHRKSYALLQLFAYKTYADYIQNQDQFPALNEAQTIKLKHLTIVSMAAESRILSYPLLMSSLAMQTIRDLEDLIIDAIYLDILRGKLDQKEAQFEVEYTMGRDLEPGKLEAMLDALKNWASTTSSVLATLDAQIISISNQTAASKAHKEEHDAHVQFVIKEVNDKKDSNNSVYSNSTSSHYAYPSPGHSGHGGSSRSRPIVLSGPDQNAMDVDTSTQQESFLGGLISGSKGKNRKAPQAETKPLRKRNKF